MKPLVVVSMDCKNRDAIQLHDVRGSSGPKLQFHLTKYFIIDKITTQTLVQKGRNVKISLDYEMASIASIE